MQGAWGFDFSGVNELQGISVAGSRFPPWEDGLVRGDFADGEGEAAGTGLF
jgi:hypothetical protein